MSTVTIVVSRGSDGYTMRIKDDASRAVVCEIEMTPEQFAGAITAATQTGVEARWIGVDKLGKRRETKEEIVTGADYDARIKAIEALEVDGWTGWHDDARNYHRSLGGDRYRVSFKRFTEAS